jgi:hypothetical protein
MFAAKGHVRFASESGHSAAQKQMSFGPLAEVPITH